MQEKFFPKVNDDNINEYLLNQEENKPGQNNLINNQNIINSQDVTDKYFVGPEEKQGKIDINAESLYFLYSSKSISIFWHCSFKFNFNFSYKSFNNNSYY